MLKVIFKNLILILGGVCFLTTTFCSCKSSFISDSDEDVAKKYSVQLVEAINSSDVDSIANLFSENSYPLGIDDGNTLIDLFKNGIEIVPTEHFSVGAEEEIEESEIIKTIQYEICVKDLTTQKQYNFLIIQCVKNSLHPKMEGMETLLVYEKDSEESFTNWWRSFDSSENPQGIRLCYFD